MCEEKRESIIKVIEQIPQQPQVQYDLYQQLRDLAIAADKLGLYDANNFIRKLVN